MGIIKSKILKPLIVFAAMLIVIFVFMAVANQVQTDFGNVDVSRVVIPTTSVSGTEGYLVAALYRPITATANNPAPGMLLLHGYQNDKAATGSMAIELARRGIVVLSLDQYGHGETSIGMINRGFVNHSVSTNFGLESVEDGTIGSIGGPSRVRVLLNFSNLSFFDPFYTTDAAGNVIYDSSMGAITAYAFMESLDFVDSQSMGVGGHSMGTWSSWSVAAAFYGVKNSAGVDITPRALLLQAGELFTDDVFDSENIRFNNVLLLQAQWDEFANFRDFNNVVTPDLPASPLRANFLGVSPEEAGWDTTFGSFADGTARRMELIYTNHRLVAVDRRGITVGLEWLDNALGAPNPLPSNNHTFHIGAFLVFSSMILGLLSMIPLMMMLLEIPFFKTVNTGLPTRTSRLKSSGKWWKGAVITMLIACFTYPFLTQLGHGLLPVPENIFRMTIGNGFFAWYVLLIIIMLFTTVIPWNKAKKRGSPMDFHDLGLAREEHANRLDWPLLGKSALLALILVLMVYLLVVVFESLFGLDFRIVWPFFRPFNLMRFGQFLVYIPIFAIFFIFNNFKIFGQMGQEAALRPGFKGFVSCWWRGTVCMAGGIFLICLIQYVPFFLNIGPGADLLFGSTFGGPFMSLLLIFFPQVLVLSVLFTALYRKTGHVYVSGITAGLLSCWIIAGGSPFL